mmetsp:Transcript_22512/g.49730  ORF Transcript_22512/g.49730 Transcript_22512/m.49730 type:complete len:212 (-) Transcript_22512:213-848(-)
MAVSTSMPFSSGPDSVGFAAGAESSGDASGDESSASASGCDGSGCNPCGSGDSAELVSTRKLCKGLFASLESGSAACSSSASTTSDGASNVSTISSLVLSRREVLSTLTSLGSHSAAFAAACAKRSEKSMGKGPLTSSVPFLILPSASAVIAGSALACAPVLSCASMFLILDTICPSDKETGSASTFVGMILGFASKVEFVDRRLRCFLLW